MEFKDLKISEKTLVALSRLGYNTPTEVQEKAIPEIIAGNNLIVRSQTGTGKTAAFGIGLIERITSRTSVMALILTPTRELAVQVCKELRSIGQDHRLRIHVVYGGQSINIQMDELTGGIDILVATPGRLLDLTRRGMVRITDFDLVVLDEADHMLDLGFQEEVTAILDQLPQKRVMILVSATIDQSILSISSTYVPHAKTIEIGEIEVASTVSEEHHEITRREKFGKLLEVLRTNPGTKTLIFMETKRGVEWLQDMLLRRGIRGVGVLHGDVSQIRRNAVLAEFKQDRLSTLIATNVAARGLHIDGLELIVNYDQAQDEETHLHRVGRTGRMGAEGKVINFVQRTESRDERMSEDHPDFAWMKQGSGAQQAYASDRPPRRRSGFGNQRSPQGDDRPRQSHSQGRPSSRYGSTQQHPRSHTERRRPQRRVFK